MSYVGAILLLPATTLGGGGWSCSLKKYLVFKDELFEKHGDGDLLQTFIDDRIHSAFNLRLAMHSDNDILILCSHLYIFLPQGLFLRGFLTKPYVHFSFTPFIKSHQLYLNENKSESHKRYIKRLSKHEKFTL
jgi:hypothetical protein